MTGASNGQINNATAPFATSSGGVTKIVAGNNVTITPSGGTGDVTVSSLQTPWTSDINGAGFSLNNAGDVNAGGNLSAQGNGLGVGQDFIGGDYGLVDTNQGILIAGNYGFNGPNGLVQEYASFGSGSGLILLDPNTPGICLQGDIYSGNDFSEVSANLANRTLNNDLGMALTWDGAGIFSTQGATFGSVGSSAGVTASTNVSAGTSLQIGTKLTTYNGVLTGGNGMPVLLTPVDLTGQTANKAATTLYAVPSSGVGIYRISSHIVLTTAGSVSSTLPNVQIVYTDQHTNGTVTIDATPILSAAGLGQTAALNTNTAGLTATGVIMINAKASTNIQYQTVNYASSAAGMAYALHIRIEPI